jgi:hypothetical protein
MKSISTGKRPLSLLLVLLIVGLVVPAALAQETTGGLQGTVKDPSGAVVSGATVDVTSPALIGKKTATTDSGGYFRFANLPPGTYTVTVNATNFRSFKQENIALQTGHLPTLDVTLQVGTASETVEVTGAAPLVDVTQSKVQTNITQDVLANVPHGRSFQSVIQFAPGARTEPLQGGSTNGSGQNGFQIDGASNSENAYLVEGQETASMFDGHSAVNVPMEFIQEVQVKSSGFEAEYGGALGGVVNVVQRRGSNEWHGSIFNYYAGDAFDSAPNRALIKDPLVGAVGAAGSGSHPGPCTAAAPCKVDQPAIYYQPKKDHYRVDTPGFELGGYLVKDRLWVFSSFAPEISQTARTVVFAPTSPTPGARTFHDNINTYYSMARVDFLATQKIRLFGSWSYSYQRGTGTSLPGTDSAYAGKTVPNPDTLYNTSSTSSADNFNGGIGYVAPNVVYNTGADITLTPNLVATARFGYFYQDYEDRGLPIGIRYVYRDTNYPYSTGNAPAPATTTALTGTLIPAKFVNAAGYANIGGNSATAFDKWKRYSFNQDLAYFKKGFGTHNFKFGYAFNHGTNNILNGYQTADVYVAYAVQYGPSTNTGLANCAAIVTQNQARYGQPGGNTDGSACQGLWGTVNLRDLGTTGKVGGWNHAFYVQDAWTIGHGVTVNAGVRLDKETLPSYQALPGFKGIDFGWGDKVAPRLGASWDVLGTGKLKVYGSFGYFFDIMKYQLPRGSFGGDYWHDCVYALDVPDYTTIIPQRDANGHYCPLGGGSVAANGTFPANGLRFIENTDYREPANDPNQIGTLGVTGLVDPSLKPMKQHEMVVGADWMISPTLALETRYSRKRLDRTIEDAGTITPDGEVYYITNPGFGVNRIQPSCNTCPVNPKAYRNYDGVEFRLNRRPGAGHWFGSFAYTYSRLYGNYSGLTATDISDSIGRNGANTDRAFDEPFMSFDASGHPITSQSPLPTDRPHTFKAYGYYTMKWWKFNTMIGAYQQAYSGTPLSSYISVWQAPVFVVGRGKYVNVTQDPVTGNWTAGNTSSKRTPMFSQTDFNFIQEMHVSKTNERLVAGVEAVISNIFNQHNAVFINQNLIRTSGLNPDRCGTASTPACPDIASVNAGFNYGQLMTTGYDYINGAGGANAQNRTLNSAYGLPFGWQNPRSMRFKIRFTF